MTDFPSSPESEMAKRLDEHAIRYANDYGYNVASDLKRAAEMLRGLAQRPSRRRIAEAIADGWTNGNETYADQNDTIRMRIDHAALAVLDLLSTADTSTVRTIETGPVTVNEWEDAVAQSSPEGKS